MSSINYQERSKKEALRPGHQAKKKEEGQKITLRLGHRVKRRRKEERKTDESSDIRVATHMSFAAPIHVFMLAVAVGDLGGIILRRSRGWQRQ